MVNLKVTKRAHGPQWSAVPRRIKIGKRLSVILLLERMVNFQGVTRRLTESLYQNSSHSNDKIIPFYSEMCGAQERAQWVRCLP